MAKILYGIFSDVLEVAYRTRESLISLERGERQKERDRGREGEKLSVLRRNFLYVL
jgi:hypothetical protein